MLEKLKLVEEKYLEMEQRAAQPDFYADPKAAARLLKEQKDLEPVVETYRRYRRIEQESKDLREMLDGPLEPDMKELCQEEYTQAKKDLENLEYQLKVLLLPRDPNDEKNVIIEIRGGVGGEESALFAHSLYRMYTMYAASKGWSVDLLNYSETELGGVKEADFILPAPARTLASSLRAASTGSSGSRRPSRAGGSTPPPPPWPSCPRWRRLTWKSVPRILRCRCSAPPARAGSISTRPPRRSV